MLADWSDNKYQVFEILDILNSMNFMILSLNAYLNKNVSFNNNLEIQILEIIGNCVSGICEFMKKEDKNRRFIIKQHDNIILTIGRISKTFSKKTDDDLYGNINSSISSILRQVMRYNKHRNEQMHLQKMHTKHKYHKYNKYSSSPPPMSVSSMGERQLVLFGKNKRKKSKSYGKKNKKFRK